MLVLAHRGYHAELPENTLAAFDAAVKLGVDGIETDLRFTRDGLPVLFHDAQAGNGVGVERLNRQELEAASGYAVPTPDEALSRWPGIFWNLEIKVPVDPQTVVRVFCPYLKSHRLLVTSFDHALVMAIAREIPSDCGFLMDERPENTSAVLARARPHANLRTLVSNYKIVDSGCSRRPRGGPALCLRRADAG